MNRWPIRAEVRLEAGKNGLQTQSKGRNLRRKRPERRKFRPESKMSRELGVFPQPVKARASVYFPKLLSNTTVVPWPLICVALRNTN